MKIEELNKETLKDLIRSEFGITDAMEHPERFQEIGLDPRRIDEIQRKLLSSSLEVLSQEAEENELIRGCIGILGQCKVKDNKLHDNILDCLMKYMDQELMFSLEATHSFYKLAELVSPEALERRIEHLVHLLEVGDEMASWNGAYALAKLAAKVDKKSLQAHISRVLNVVRLNTGFRKAHAISALAKLYHYADLKEEILDTLLLAAQDFDENIRRASIFALSDCISEGTKDKILNLFEELLEDEVKTVKYGALEALTEVLPYKVSSEAFCSILEFLEADEPWVRWRVVLAINKAYSELDASEKERAINALSKVVQDGDIFVRVKTYEAFLNIRDLDKQDFPKIDEALKRESDFVQRWVLYNFDQR